MKKKEFNIKKIGPLWKIEGMYSFVHPYKTEPLNGYFDIPVEDGFYDPLEKVLKEWYDEFPNCCAAHIELSENILNFSKGEYSFIPTQVVNNLKFYLHCLHTFLDDDNWYEEIIEYLEYLLDSLGMPNLGGHIFKQALNIVTETFEFEDRNFTDDQRLAILEYLEPKEIVDDSTDIEVLYHSFERWLSVLPEFGKFKDIKTRLKGKLPMNVFISEWKYNRYNGKVLSRYKSKEKLVDDLTSLTNQLLSEIDEHGVISRERQSYDINQAAKERLNIKQKILLNSQEDSNEISYLSILQQWLENEIEYYQTITTEVIKKQSGVILENTEELHLSTQDILSGIDLIRIDVAALSDELPVTREWLDQYVTTPLSKKLDDLIHKIEGLENDSDFDQMNSVLKNMWKKINETDGAQKEKQVGQELSRADISIKHKLKISIPIYFGVKYESEIEIAEKQKMPRNWKEFKELFIE